MDSIAHSRQLPPRQAAFRAMSPQGHSRFPQLKPCLLVVLVSSVWLAPSPAWALATDATFVFTADAHVSFNGYDDHQGIVDDVLHQRVPPANMLLIANETPIGYTDQCIADGFSFAKDLCNQIQVVRKLNHLPGNFWNAGSFDQNGHSTKLASAGQKIAAPLGVIVAGDLTECGAGSHNVTVWDGGTPHQENCDVDYESRGVSGAQLALFKQLFDKDLGTPYQPLSSIAVINSLLHPDSDVPMHYPLYPSLGNHDLGFDKSGLMMDYIRAKNLLPPPISSRKLTSYDFNSGDYSWDWGKLHVVNVGVYAGSSNVSKATDANYAYSQAAMDWLANDLRKYASDGRPVILAQHFGFDANSLSKSWYGGDPHKEGLAKIWPVLAPYNVIGIFHGHSHSQAFYSFTPGETYVNGVRFVPPPRLAYDVFESAPAFTQDFLAVRVTDNSMDVQATQRGSDFKNDGSGVVNLSNSALFSKRLVQPPLPGAVLTVEANDSIAASVAFNGWRYLIGAGSDGKYTVRFYNPTLTPTIQSTGVFTVSPRYMTTYTNSSTGYVLVSDGNTMVNYRVNPSGTLTKLWAYAEKLRAMAIIYKAGLPYLVADESPSQATGSIRLHFFRLSAGAVTDLDVVEFGTPTCGIANPLMCGRPQLIAYGKADGSYGLVRYVPTGEADMLRLDWSGTQHVNSVVVGHETWTTDSGYDNIAFIRPNVFIQPVTLPDASTALLVKSPTCLRFNLAGACAGGNLIDSPFVVRTFVQDGNGTQVSWRGQLKQPYGLYTLNAISAFPLDSANGLPVVGFYGREGFFSRLSIQGDFIN